jgi:hypothetical protein
MTMTAAMPIDLPALHRMLLQLRVAFLAERERVNQLETILERLCLETDSIALLERRMAELETRRQSGIYCVACGSAFNASRSDAMYCSARCRSQAWRERRTERQSA